MSIRSLSFFKSLLSPNPRCFFSKLQIKNAKKMNFSSLNKDPSHIAAAQEPPYTELERDFLEPEDFYNLLISKGKLILDLKIPYIFYLLLYKFIFLK